MSKIYKVILFSSIISLLLYIFLFYGDTGIFPSIKKNFDSYAWSVITGVISGFALLIISQKLNEAFPWRIAFGKRFFSGFALNLISTLIISVALIYLYFLLPFQDIPFKDFYARHFDTTLKFFILIFVVVLFYTISDFSVFSFNQYAKGQIETARLKRTLLNLQFEALKSQLSPHYLFNSLNTISSLIYRDITIAEEFIRKLALTYQSILDTYDKNLVNLSEELKIVEAYKFLMEIRFEKAFQVYIDIPKTIHQTKVPPLAIQMLMENAIKHNAISEEKPLHVTIYHEKDCIIVSNNHNAKPYYLTVENNLIQNPAFGKSYKIGLENIKRRYSFYTDKKISIEKNSKFTVRLPVLNIKQTSYDEKKGNNILKLVFN